MSPVYCQHYGVEEALLNMQLKEGRTLAQMVVPRKPIPLIPFSGAWPSWILFVVLISLFQWADSAAPRLVRIWIKCSSNTAFLKDKNTPCQVSEEVPCKPFWGSLLSTEFWAASSDVQARAGTVCARRSGSWPHGSVLECCWAPAHWEFTTGVQWCKLEKLCSHWPLRQGHCSWWE